MAFNQTGMNEMMKSRPFPIGYGRLAFVAAAALFASPAHAQLSPVPSMPIIAQVGDFHSMPNAAYFSSLGMQFVSDCISRNLAQNGWPDQQSTTADVARLTAALGPQRLICIDIEEFGNTGPFSLDIRTSPKATVDAHIAYLEKIIGWIRSANPCAKVGIYGALPIGNIYWETNDYYAALRLRSNSYWVANFNTYQQNYQAWQNANAYLAPLSRQVDYIMPGIHQSYNYYEELDSGATDGVPPMAFAIIAESRKYNKPVYPFIFPEFQDSNMNYLPEANWKRMLQLTRDYADGIIIWNDGVFHNETWYSGATWWQDSIAFANSLSVSGALGGNIGVLATPPEGVYPSAQSVSLAAAGAGFIRWSLTTTWPNYNYPTCSTANFYSGPINVSTSGIILATACYPDGSSMSWDFAYVLQ